MGSASSFPLFFDLLLLLFLLRVCQFVLRLFLLVNFNCAKRFGRPYFSVSDSARVACATTGVQDLFVHAPSPSFAFPLPPSSGPRLLLYCHTGSAEAYAAPC